MNPNANLVISRNIFWKLREIIEDHFTSWIYNTDYSIKMSYPENGEDITVYPSFVIDDEGFIPKPYQIGARDKATFFYDIVIVSDNKPQRTYLNMLVWDNFHNRDYVLYDMSASEPSIVGDYSALSTKGIFRCLTGRCRNMEIRNDIDRKMRYESWILFDVECPNYS